MRKAFVEGIAWGEAKKQLFELINDEIAPARARYDELMADPGYVEEVLQQGASRARQESVELITKVREAVGISAMV